MQNKKLQNAIFLTLYIHELKGVYISLEFHYEIIARYRRSFLQIFFLEPFTKSL